MVVFILVQVLNDLLKIVVVLNGDNNIYTSNHCKLNLQINLVTHFSRHCFEVGTYLSYLGEWDNYFFIALHITF